MPPRPPVRLKTSQLENICAGDLLAHCKPATALKRWTLSLRRE
jgi:hypothetical protein